MALPRRPLLIVLGSIVALILLIAIAIPLFLNGDAFRARIETALTASLGRKVTLGKLDLSVLTGSLVAGNASIADDPAFSTEPFLQASRVKIGIEIFPLIFSREIHITSFAIDAPKITLLRAAKGTWNYSTIGSAQQNTAANKESSTLIPNLTVGHVTISDGRLTVGTESAPGMRAIPRRIYDQLSIDVKDFSFQKSFPFTVSAHLPGDGTVSLKGNAGPINPHDASLTPFDAHLEAKHIDPLAAGFVESSSGVTGTIEAIDVQASWNGQLLHVVNLVVDTPKLTLVRDNKPTTVAPAPPAPDSNNMLSTLTADHLQIKNGAITITSPGQAIPAVYQQLNAELTNVSPTAASPFKLSAQIPGGGSVTGNGTAGPLNQASAVATPLNAHIAISHLDLATSGVVAPDAGISGIANLDLKALSDGKILMPTRPPTSRGCASQRTVHPLRNLSSFSSLPRRTCRRSPANSRTRSSPSAKRSSMPQAPTRPAAASPHSISRSTPKLHRSTSLRRSCPRSASIYHPARASRAEPSPPISTSPVPARLPSSAVPSASTTLTLPALTSVRSSGPSVRLLESSRDPAQPSSRSARTSQSTAEMFAPTTSQLSSPPSDRLPDRARSAQQAHSTTTPSSNSPAYLAAPAGRVALFREVSPGVCWD